MTRLEATSADEQLQLTKGARTRREKYDRRELKTNLAIALGIAQKEKKWANDVV